MSVLAALLLLLSVLAAVVYYCCCCLFWQLYCCCCLFWQLYFCCCCLFWQIYAAVVVYFGSCTTAVVVCFGSYAAVVVCLGSYTVVVFVVNYQAKLLESITKTLATTAPGSYGEVICYILCIHYTIYEGKIYSEKIYYIQNCSIQYIGKATKKTKIYIQ